MLNLDKYRKLAAEEPGPESRVRVVTVRMPFSLHARLRGYAQGEKVSMNGVCLAALEQACDDFEAAQPQAGSGQ